MKNDKNRENSVEIEKGKVHITVGIVEYSPNAVLSRTILRKSSGNVTALSFAEGEELEEKISPFDVFIQIIDGKAELVMNRKKYELITGHGLVIPAHVNHCFNAKQQFKMLSTVIKSGYDDVSL